jgi:glutamine---fructose-6-phosphate transaminase (isomerizing)
MCGIVGSIGKRDCLPALLEGLARVEYRGYDSSGIALITTGGLKVCKRAGKLKQLIDSLPKRLSGNVGIGHTRWATHGEPNDVNAHPHTDVAGTVAVVHNGIIENAAELRVELESHGVMLVSETDTECLAHLIAQQRSAGHDLEDAVRLVLARIEGTYGIAVLDTTQPDRLVIARNGSPLIIGVGDKEMMVASDIAALVRHTTQVVHLGDGEMAVLKSDGYRTFALDATPTQSRLVDINWSIEQFDRGGHEHFLRKEILEQPAAVERALKGRLDDRFATVRLGGITLSAREVLAIRRIKFIACGSAYYAGLAGAQLVESLARIPSDAEPASEFRYRNPVIEKDALYVAISQSGETLDTLAAVQEIKRKGGNVIAIVNVVGSTIARECDGIYLHAGPEISVASTKVFTSMLVSMAMFAIQLGRVRDLSPFDGARLIAGLRRLPADISTILESEPDIAAIASRYAYRPSMFFIGRGAGFPIALEGAQKLKEISYVHAEAYPSSELKHGPLALVNEEFPVVAIVGDDALFEKNMSSVQQVRARKGPVIGIVQKLGVVAHQSTEAGLFNDMIEVPVNEPELNPILWNIPLQLLAYHAARTLGRDVDQPRNLAKSVTVE